METSEDLLDLYRWPLSLLKLNLQQIRRSTDTSTYFPAQQRLHSIQLTAKPGCQPMAHPTPLLLVTGCQFCLMLQPQVQFCGLLKTTYGSSQLFPNCCFPFFYFCQLRGMIYDTCLYQQVSWLFFLMVFFLDCTKCYPSILIESSTVCVAVLMKSWVREPRRHGDR